MMVGGGDSEVMTASGVEAMATVCDALLCLSPSLPLSLFVKQATKNKARLMREISMECSAGIKKTWIFPPFNLG